MKNFPDYKRIYQDMFKIKYPDLQLECSSLLNKENLSVMDVLKIDNIISINTKKELLSGRFRSYDELSILEILRYQKKNKLNNSQLALHFKLSRNTVAKWKNIYGYR